MDIVALLILIVVAVYAIMIYNGLVKARQMVREAWSGIDVQLKRRADLIPNLIETVKGYAKHEQDTLTEVIEMRNRAQAVPNDDVAGRAQAEGLLGMALGLKPRKVGVHENISDARAFVREKGLA